MSSVSSPSVGFRSIRLHMSLVMLVAGLQLLNWKTRYSLGTSNAYWSRTSNANSCSTYRLVLQSAGLLASFRRNDRSQMKTFDSSPGIVWECEGLNWQSGPGCLGCGPASSCRWSCRAVVPFQLVSWFPALSCFPDPCLGVKHLSHEWKEQRSVFVTYLQHLQKRFMF